VVAEAIQEIVEGRSLNFARAKLVMAEIMEGKATPAQIAALITALRMKGETVEEISGFAEAMREHALNIRPSSVELLDTCGTGGDRLSTFNISTTSAFVVAGGGVTIAKHGNRSVSSESGSADVLETLGVKIDLPPEKVTECIEEVGIGFLFAPVFHKAMKYALGPRQEIGIRTVFNILGPLTNPAGATYQLLGVYDGNLTEVLAKALGKLGIRRAFVVHGVDGLDEVSTIGETVISELVDDQVKTFRITPEEFGIPRANSADIAGGTAAENASIVRAILQGEKGARRDIVVLNSGLAFVAAGKAESIEAGIKLAEDSIDSGAALEKLERLRLKSNS
jgi:anthranilate phosphoribosyltransferase